MDMNDIKKLLYKENPKSEITVVGKDGINYRTVCGEVEVVHNVPFSDIGDGFFYPTMDAKLLIRYIMFYKINNPQP